MITLRSGESNTPSSSPSAGAVFAGVRTGSWAQEKSAQQRTVQRVSRAPSFLASIHSSLSPFAVQFLRVVVALVVLGVTWTAMFLWEVSLGSLDSARYFFDVWFLQELELSLGTVLCSELLRSEL